MQGTSYFFLWVLSYSRKSLKKGSWGYIYFSEKKKPLKFLDLSLYSVKLCDTPLMGIRMSKTKTHENSTWVFCEHPWKFHFFFNWPLEFPHVPSSKSLENLDDIEENLGDRGVEEIFSRGFNLLTCLGFSGIAHLVSLGRLVTLSKWPLWSLTHRGKGSSVTDNK